MTIFERVKKLGFPLGKYVVVGGIMEAHGIRPAKDADIVVTPDLLEELIQRGWPVCECEVCLKSRPRRMLKGDGVDILSDYSWQDKYLADTDEIIKNADIVQGVAFAKLDVLLAWKEAYAQGLPADNKHVMDIELIRSHVRNCQCFK